MLTRQRICSTCTPRELAATRRNISRRRDVVFTRLPQMSPDCSDDAEPRWPAVGEIVALALRRRREREADPFSITEIGVLEHPARRRALLPSQKTTRTPKAGSRARERRYIGQLRHAGPTCIDLHTCGHGVPACCGNVK